MAVLGCLPKLKRGLELALGAHFLHVFSVKVSLFNPLMPGGNKKVTHT